jgi:hypothetical protein
MNSKIEVCKTCNGTGIEYDGAGHACTACNGVAAPVAERQQHECKCSAGMAVVPWLHAKHCPVSCYTATPELAELQALNADAPAVNKTLNQQVDALQTTIAQLESKINRAINLDFERRAEIERLKGGQGEPVAYMRNEGTPNNLVKCTFMCPGAFGVYRQPPAPVSEVSLRNFANSMIDIALEGGNADGAQIQELAVEHGLLKPEQRTERCGDTCSCAEYSDFPVECFRKVKELNQ